MYMYVTFSTRECCTLTRFRSAESIMANDLPTERDVAVANDRPDIILPKIARLERVPEILAEIFARCIPYGDVLPDARKPFNFTHVCKSWRYIALTTPLLWSRFTLSGYNCSTKREDRILDAWLRRSGGTPLTVHLCLYGQETVGEVLWRCMIVLISHMRRWRSIVVAMPWPFLKHILRRIGKKTPRIQSLTLIRTSGIIPRAYLTQLDDSRGEVQHESLDDVPSMPSEWRKYHNGRWRDIFSHIEMPIKFKHKVAVAKTLQSITLDGLVCVPSMPRRMPHPGKTNMKQINPRSIRHLFLPNIISFSALELLRITTLDPETLQVSISCEVHVRPPSDNVVPVTLPVLRYLEIESQGNTSHAAECVGSILDFLTAPALKRLSIGTLKTAVSNWNHLSGFLRRSKAPLTHLRISNLAFSETEFIDALREAPMLQHLYTDSVEVSDVTLRALTIPSRGNMQLDEQSNETTFLGLCPDLIYLNLDVVAVFTGNAIIEMLLSRWRKKNRSTIECYIRRLATRTVTAVLDSPDIKRCVDEGLCLFI